MVLSRRTFAAIIAFTVAVFTTCAARATLAEDSPAKPATGAATEPTAVDDTPTHHQTAIIKIADEQGAPLPLHTFCVGPQGNLFAGVGNGEGLVRVYDCGGGFVKSWSTAVVAEAINAAPDGSLLVAGAGRLLRYTLDGELLLDKPAPHVASLLENKQKLREQIIVQIKQTAQRYGVQMKTYKQTIKRYQDKIAKLQAKEQLTDADKQKQAMYGRYIESLSRAIKRLEQVAPRPANQEPAEEQIQQRIKSLIAAKAKVAAISAAADDVFLTCSAQTGYGFDVWRTDDQFESAIKIVTGLRGCCGQMDVQASDDGVFVAENTRKQVRRFDRDGKLILEWGSTRAQGLLGFGSCCNPMNLAFGPGGDVYTAEATTGRIKRYHIDGTLASLVGTVELVPGCKKVSIAVNGDGSRVYMMDMTRNHIIVMSRQETEPAEAVSQANMNQEQT